MRTAFHVVMILVTGLVMGLIYRSLSNQPSQNANLPGPDEIVHTTDVAPGTKLEPTELKIENTEPVHPVTDEAWLSRFELTERSGKTVNSEDLLGEPYVVSFFFSTCPSICPQQNRKLKELQDEFEGQGVKFLAISVDPETDTPEVLREYAARFGADKDQWLFMTGDLTYVRRIGAEIFQQPVDKKFHTERLVLVDSAGKIEGLYLWPEKAQFEKLKKSIKRLLADKES
ncbi:SCO family protein [Stieleria varia]|uniref:Thioredoxin domain-containing protein n=1 Tax=Stieleria varia TaxID=2528005 RepID=A0A5C6A3U3_9BACT|nr:SCO family protein [Stieleria varia]TWT94572.1 hypothetical protein Pla52n_53930 [Stieleria varia]